MSHQRDSTQETVLEVARIVTEMAGIQLGPRQLPMIENRLKTRMLRLKLESFESYLTYLKQNRESESQALLSLMTTHHTFFFREFSHFEFLLNKGLLQLIEAARARPDKTIRVLSAACSRGHEVYSLAMFFDFHLKSAAPDVNYEIWGTDVDPESVSHAKNGVYRADELKQSPAMYLNQNWIRGTGNVREFSKVKDSIKSKCHFSTANLLSYDSFLAGRKFDVIFCRNVFIYFNPDQIKKVSERLLGSLFENGFLFVGLSESLTGLNLKVDSVGPSIYQHVSQKRVSKVAPAAATIAKPKVIDVLCVDDSPAIHALLKKILVAEEGFRITATAKNGLEAQEILAKQRFDCITLDLHMPEMDGVGFLESRKDKTPVLVISSINRDDTSIAQKALSLGAKDYVEKPSLENLAQAGNEIRSKLKMILSASGAPVVKLNESQTASKSIRRSKVKVMIVDDSKTIRNLLKSILSQDSRFEVISEIERPTEALKAIELQKPDLVTLDIHMPEMNGVELLKKIQSRHKIPAVMISSISKEEGTFVLDALAAGAVDYIQKPAAHELARISKDICDRLFEASHAQIITRSLKGKKAIKQHQIDLDSMILIGASTGGTEALRVVLESLPSEIPPILIVQHIPPVFSTAFAERLNQLCPFDVKEAADGDEVKPNRVLVAPGGKQMGLKVRNQKTFVEITDAPPVNRHKPSVDYLFQSAADLKFPNVIAAVLTGMGADGARQLKTLRDQGARTVAQNEETCVVFGMPKEAIQKGGAEFVLPLGEIGSKLLQLCQAKKVKAAS